MQALSTSKTCAAKHELDRTILDNIIVTASSTANGSHTSDVLITGDEDTKPWTSGEDDVMYVSARFCFCFNFFFSIL